MTLEELEIRERLYALIQEDRQLSEGERADYQRMLREEGDAIVLIRRAFDRLQRRLEESNDRQRKAERLRGSTDPAI